MAKFKVLSTKTLDASLISIARENDIEIVQQDFISIIPVWNQETYHRIIEYAKKGVCDIVFTSANAVDILNSYLVAEDTFWVVDWNIFCLSGKTRRAIHAATFLQKNILGTADSGSELADVIITIGCKEILFFCGERRREELPVKLRQAGIIVHEIILYKTVHEPVKITDDYDAILFFSPSGVNSFFSANTIQNHVKCFSIGPTTTNSIRTFTSNPVCGSRIAPDPGDLINEVITHFKQKSGAI